MNAATLLMIPSRTTLAGTRWIMIVFMGLVLMLSIALGTSDTLLVAPIVGGYVEVLVGLLLVAPFLVLAIDTKQLCVPRIQHSLVFGMILYAALWIIIPSTGLSIANGHFAVIAAIQSLGLVYGLSMGLLPRFFMIVAGFIPILLIMMHMSLHYTKEYGVMELWIAIALLLPICALCWWRQLRLSDPYRQSFNKPIVLGTRLASSVNYNNWSPTAAAYGTGAKIRSQPRWLRSTANLHNSGPNHVPLSLRIAFGGWFLPKTWQSAVRQWMALLAPIIVLLALACAAYGSVIRAVVFAIWHALTFSAAIWIASFSSTLLSLMSIMVLQQRWLGSNAELSLLALLPQLGHRAALIKDLLRASLLPALFWQCVIIALLLAAAIAQHADRLNLAIAALIQITAIAFTPAFALALFGGRSLSPGVVGATAGTGFGLVGIGTGVMANLGGHERIAWVVAASMIACWLIILAFLVWLGIRGWQGLQTRPHPFLTR